MSQEITMLCYKNRTWCNFNNCTKFNVSKCDRAYTDSIDQRAHIWWNHKKDYDTHWETPPVSFYADKPECFTEKTL